MSHLVTPLIVVCQAPLSMGLSRHEHWSGLPFPSPGDLPDPGIKPESLISPAFAGGFLPAVPPGKPRFYYSCVFKLLINSQIASSVVIRFMKVSSISTFLRVCTRNGWWILSIPKIRKANLRWQRVKSWEWSSRWYYVTDLRLICINHLIWYRTMEGPPKKLCKILSYIEKLHIYCYTYIYLCIYLK